MHRPLAYMRAGVNYGLELERGEPPKQVELPVVGNLQSHVRAGLVDKHGNAVESLDERRPAVARKHAAENGSPSHANGSWPVVMR